METPIEEGSIFWLVALGCAVMIMLALSLILFYTLHRRKLTTKELLMQGMTMQHQEELLQHNVEVQEIERKRIARDLHDEIGSRLNLSRLHLAQLKGGDNENPEELINQSLKLLDTAIESSRQITQGLLPPVLEEFGLEHALRELLGEIELTTNIQTSFICNGTLQTARGDMVELGIFRIAQEAINNAVKHANANSIIVHLEISDATVLRVVDNGNGLKPRPDKKQGMGLKNIETRAKMIGGSVTWSTTAPKGTTVQLKLQNTAKND